MCVYLYGGCTSRDVSSMYDVFCFHWFAQADPTHVQH